MPHLQAAKATSRGGGGKGLRWTQQYACWAHGVVIGALGSRILQDPDIRKSHCHLRNGEQDSSSAPGSVTAERIVLHALTTHESQSALRRPLAFEGLQRCPPLGPLLLPPWGMRLERALPSVCLFVARIKLLCCVAQFVQEYDFAVRRRCWGTCGTPNFRRQQPRSSIHSTTQPSMIMTLQNILLIGPRPACHRSKQPPSGAKCTSGELEMCRMLAPVIDCSFPTTCVNEKEALNAGAHTLYQWPKSHENAPLSPSACGADFLC